MDVFVLLHGFAYIEIHMSRYCIALHLIARISCHLRLNAKHEKVIEMNLVKSEK